MSRLSEILREIRPEEEFAASSDFIADGLLDSFDVITLVAELDKAYAISIEGVQIVPENFRSLDAIASLLRRHGVEP
ncbi:MAG TPA: phosphopantetheine-binding protein [Thermoanaerobaculia bacterium]|nr:phosphopantetheine-binding protein [Thermoanaerobaculia bacterium]